MPTTAVFVTNDQPGLPSDRVQRAWYLRLNALHGAKVLADAIRAYHNAVGYTQALRDAELITNETELAMTSTLAEVWKVVVDRLEAHTVAKNA
ncbi:hypothetical protein [Pseudomonas fildesensis]|uniref:Uncharacterized protein n=1 Tax=Pseudomonas fildesensis TaxID=1674920 RepID=A0A0J8FQE8_9PSED|nr:hypothetical protein [Pseudomonas fildesensis]KMT52450.1 hypothetical protein ACR52_27045 [Pseudomonas fildesensis]